jgi:hypothetical protein
MDAMILLACLAPIFVWRATLREDRCEMARLARQRDTDDARLRVALLRAERLAEDAPARLVVTSCHMASDGPVLVAWPLDLN